MQPRSARDDPGSQTLDRPSARLDWLACGVLAAAVVALYLPFGIFAPGHTLHGIDFESIHDRRIAFVQEAFARHGLHLPGWYPRELMGTPFWSNVQSFPFLPTRLALLWIPHDLVFPVAVNLAAILAALSTWLFLRRLGLGRIASVAGGWTFAASGFFASRVLAGHLPLLEAFAALPLLLWCVERIAQTDPEDRARLRCRFLALVLASLCVVLAGHPQVPAYAVGVALLYAVLRARGRARIASLTGIGAGIASSAFVWWPMLRLIGRSTRILPLDPPANDLAFPYWRLKAFLFPWADGWPSSLHRLPMRLFVDPDGAKFWDTVCYVGWLPWIAAAFLVERAVRGRLRADRRLVLVAAIGLGALLLSLPFAQEFTSQFRVTLLRSPARLLYVTTFALAAVTAAAVDVVARARGASRDAVFRGAGAVAALSLLVLHGADLGSHARAFVEASDRLREDPQELEKWRVSVADQRFAFDDTLLSLRNRAVDDVGFFDSIMLARPYRAFMAFAGVPETANVQTMDGKMLPPAALAALCVESVITALPRDDLQVRKLLGVATLYAVPNPARRASFLPDDAVAFVGDELVLDRFRRGAIELAKTMFLSPTAKAALSPPMRAEAEAVPSKAPLAGYARPDPDTILVRTDAPRAGFLRLVESFDEGWSATLDGAPANVLVADTFAMAVRLPPGRHELRFTFRTPGAVAGLWITAASVALVALLAFGAGRTRPTDVDRRARPTVSA